MGYKDPVKQAAFQNAWMKKRRTDWTAQNGPCHCGATEHLSVVHLDPLTRKTSHFWSFSDERRAEELKKCRVMCRDHAREHWAKIYSEREKGSKGISAKLNPEIVWAIRGRLMGRESIREIARCYSLNHRTVSDIRRGKIWSWLKGGRRTVSGLKKVTNRSKA